mmetsp:Transcript_16639/g.24603  ORF Transcript_16639/g.24603 Transcript_16639/m.24603 type:complete len:135 (+) Transcript_16639:216-620(+)
MGDALSLDAHPELCCMFKNIPHPVINDTAVDIIIREADWSFWQACLSELEDKNPQRIRKRVAVIGSPGIGKSTTALFVIRKLLELKKTVVYKIKDEGCYVIFTPNRDSPVVTGVPGTTPETELMRFSKRRHTTL